MKKILLFMIVCCTINATAQNISFSDPDFKAALISAGIDTDNDSEISQTEALAVNGFNFFNNSAINDLGGIEFFTNIESIGCVNCGINVSPDLSDLTGLLNLYLGDNNLTSIDVSFNTDLLEFSMPNNGLTSIDLTNNTELTLINISGNSITAMDTSNQNDLLSLIADNNALTSLNISSCTDLEVLTVNDNSLSAIDITNNVDLISFVAFNNSITEIDARNNTALINFNANNNNGLEYINIANGTNASLTTFTVTNNTDLTCIKVDDPAAANTYSGWTKDNSATYAFTCGPNLSISAPSTTGSNGSTAIFIFTEPVTGFDISDINITNGIASNFTINSAVQYTALITPNFVCGQQVNISVPEAAAQNLDGRDSEPSQLPITTTDDIPPTLTCPANTTVECGDSTDPTVTGTATAFDNCEPVCQPITYPLAESDGGTEITYCGFFPCSGPQPDWGDVTIMQDSNNLTISIQMNQSVGAQWYLENVRYYLAPDTSFNTAANIPIEDSNWTSVAPPSIPASYTITIPLVDVPSDSCYALGIIVGAVQKNFLGNPDAASRRDLYAFSPTSTNQSVFLPDYCAIPCGTSNTVITSSDNFLDTCGNTSIITRTWTATDTNGNISTCDQIINVVDTTGPTITCPTNIVVNNDANSCGAVVNYSATATDSCGGIFSLTYDIASGNIFPIGTTTVNVTATDVCDNQSTCFFTVTVNDIEAPVMSCPANQTVSVNQGSTYTVPDYLDGSFVSPSDNCPLTSLTLAQTPAPNTQLSAGTYTITLSATDSGNNSDSCTFDLVVNEVLSVDGFDVNNYKIYPNPVLKYFKIDGNLPVENVKIFDLNGKLVKHFLKDISNYNVDDLHSGLYFVKITTNRGIATKKLIKH
ncbi:HYR domain-containing protein [Winogradskyella flava]|uniref:HYR domain-containing protein n=1 Tax=Winogradskyella flava TaxID=1884876 RepID=UPI00248FF711|nr:HYR domain-containing protein [Winogradskyella flava]